jgi:hypothetical protein
MQLAPFIAATVSSAGLSGVFVSDMRRGEKKHHHDAISSQVVLIARDEADLDAARGWPGAQDLVAGDAVAWTDDYSDILGALLKKYWR